MRLSPLNRKLLREVWHLRTQMLSIALVVACGIMTVVTMRGTYESLAAALDRYYRDYRFADVFASMERAPNALARTIAQVDGVAAVETRVAFMANLNVPGLSEPAVGLFLSLPEREAGGLNAIHLLRGRRPDPDRPDEILSSESFATANQLDLGSSIEAIVNGRRRRLEIVGVAISPDYIGEIAPGAVFPDDRRFTVIRMNADALAGLTGMEGAFNDLALRLSPGASESRVVEELDRLLEPYGGLGAYGRNRHPSHEAVRDELEQNRITGTLIPAIFLGVAAFLLSIVLRRLIGTQRTEIAVLKAFGYRNSEIGSHYLRFALIPVLIGGVLGIGTGIWFGGGLTGLYAEYFRFPDLRFDASWRLIAIAFGVSVLAATVGALGAVRRAIQLQPAEAMRPEAPATFRPGPIERVGIGNRLSASGRLIIRSIERQPFRSLASTIGIALSTAMIAATLVIIDSTRYMANLQFEQVQREDLSVVFNTPRPSSVRYELADLSGVTRVELARTIPVRIRHLHRERTTALTGLERTADLRRLVDRNGQRRTVPEKGLLLSATLAEVLAVSVGDTVSVSVLEGARPELRIPVAATVDEMFGMGTYMEIGELHQAIGQAPAATEAFLGTRREAIVPLNERLKNIRSIGSVYSPDVLRGNFEQQLSEGLYISVGFLLGIACILAIGVIYNGARIALSERGRELASLRVLGFTRREVAVLLLGEQTALTIVAIPLGWATGLGLIAFVLQAMASERYRFPLVITGSTFFIAATVTAAAAFAAAFAVRRRLDRLDLIEVLKTRE